MVARDAEVLRLAERRADLRAAFLAAGFFLVDRLAAFLPADFLAEAFFLADRLAAFRGAAFLAVAFFLVDRFATFFFVAICVAPIHRTQHSY